MTLVSTLITRIRYRLYEPKKGADGESSLLFFKDSEIIEYMNDGISDLCEDTEVNYRQFFYTTTDTLSEWPITTLTSDNILLELYNIYYNQTTDQDTTYRPLLKQSVEDLKLYSTDNNILIGQIYDDTLFLNKANTTGDIFVIDGKFGKTALTADSDTFPLNKLSETAVLFYATAMGFYKREKFDTGDKWYTLYLDKKANIAKHSSKLIRTDIPDDMQVYKGLRVGFERATFPIEE